MRAFPCNQCGQCCRNVHLAEQTRFLDRGDGVCRHFSEDSKHCTIYVDRPDICRVDRQYRMHYAERYAWDEFVELNLQVCQVLAFQS
ncbi:YkgJ family cysteine cluster protein [Pseudomonas sp. JUb42]|uniref:YkgJ family cysteine cluster protein n=1 Tax=Pseudomonas sp. JUb42 TaxID=2940611 RepID=UPI0038F6A75A